METDYSVPPRYNTSVKITLPAGGDIKSHHIFDNATAAVLTDGTLVVTSGRLNGPETSYTRTGYAPGQWCEFVQVGALIPDGTDNGWEV